MNRLWNTVSHSNKLIINKLVEESRAWKNRFGIFTVCFHYSHRTWWQIHRANVSYANITKTNKHKPRSPNIIDYMRESSFNPKLMWCIALTKVKLSTHSKYTQLWFSNENSNDPICAEIIEYYILIEATRKHKRQRQSRHYNCWFVRM